MARTAHPAIQYAEAGRGYGKTRYAVVKLGLVGKSGRTWHILDPNSAICNTRGVVQKTYEQMHPCTVRLDGLGVCARCRSLLGPVPQPEFLTGKDAA